VNHLIFILYLLAFFSGIFNSVILQYLYHRYRNRLVKDYFHFILALTVLEMVYVIIIYLQIYQKSIRLYPELDYMLITSLIDLSLVYTAQKLYLDITEQNEMRIIFSVSLLIGAIIISSIPGMIFINRNLSADIRDISITLYFYILSIAFLIYRRKAGKGIFIYYKKIAAVLIATLSCIGAGIFLKKLPSFAFIPQAAFFFSSAFIITNIITLFYIRIYLNRELRGFPSHIKEQYNLTDREMEIVRFVRSGLTNPQIAEQLFISPKTVRNHLYAIFRKTGVENRYELMKLG
jgi:DNA-binding CsgD family transcriptional regulator